MRSLLKSLLREQEEREQEQDQEQNNVGKNEMSSTSMCMGFRGSITVARSGERGVCEGDDIEKRMMDMPTFARGPAVMTNKGWYINTIRTRDGSIVRCVRSDDCGGAAASGSVSCGECSNLQTHQLLQHAVRRRLFGTRGVS